MKIILINLEQLSNFFIGKDTEIQFGYICTWYCLVIIVDVGKIEHLGVDGLEVQSFIQMHHLLSELLIHVLYLTVLLLLRLILIQVVDYGLKLNLTELLRVRIEPTFNFWGCWHSIHIKIEVVVVVVH